MNARFSIMMLALSVSTMMMTGCGPLPGKPTAADVPIAPDKLHDFAGLFRENCAGCHGPDGKGNGALALANPVYLAIVGEDTIRHVVAQGVPGTQMPPFAQSAGGMLTDEQIDILAKGIRTNWSKANALNGAPAPPYAARAAGNVQHGAVANGLFCASCHGANGEGTVKAGSIVDVSYLALVSDQGLRTTVIAGRPELGHPDWRGYVPGRPMTDDDVTDVVAWLAAHRSLTPGQPYASSH